MVNQKRLICEYPSQCLLQKVFADVKIEPPLQPVNDDQARVDIRARCFWKMGQTAYFDVRINPKPRKDKHHGKVRKTREREEKTTLMVLIFARINFRARENNFILAY